MIGIRVFLEEAKEMQRSGGSRYRGTERVRGTLKDVVELSTLS